MKQIALVTGANRGIGFEVSRQMAELGYHVIMTGRDAEKITEASRELLEPTSLSVETVEMDLS